MARRGSDRNRPPRNSRTGARSARSDARFKAKVTPRVEPDARERPRNRVLAVGLAAVALALGAYGAWRWRASDDALGSADGLASAQESPDGGTSEDGFDAGGEIPRVDDLAALDPAVAAAIRDAIAAVEREPSSGTRWGELGIVYNAHRYYDLADRCYAKAARLDVQAASWPHLRGVLAEERGDAAAAASLYRAALAVQPADQAARYRLGNVLLTSNDLAAAEAAYRELEASSPREPWGALGLGRVAQRRGEHEAAARSFEQALALDPENEQAAHLLAGAYRELGDTERARQLADSARDGVRAKSPADPIVDRVRGSLRNLQSVVLAAKQTAAAGDVDRAVALYAGVLEVDPVYYDALYGLALLEGRRGRYPEAQALLERALAVRPKSSEARLMLSVALSSQNQLDAARAELRKLLENDPEHGLAKDMLLQLGA